jgi:hypothetical protein
MDMNASELVAELGSAGPKFLSFFREVLDKQITKTVEVCGYEDTHFIAAITAMFDDVTCLHGISVEHQNALGAIYKACKAAWVSVGGSILL